MRRRGHQQAPNELVMEEQMKVKVETDQARGRSKGGPPAGIIGRSETTSGRDAMSSNPRSGEGAWNAERAMQGVRRVYDGPFGSCQLTRCGPAHLAPASFPPHKLCPVAPSCNFKTQPAPRQCPTCLVLPFSPSRTSSPHFSSHSKAPHNSPPVYFSPTSATRSWFPC